MRNEERIYHCVIGHIPIAIRKYQEFSPYNVHTVLVGGFNPFEQYAVLVLNWIISPSRGENTKNETTS